MAAYAREAAGRASLALLVCPLHWAFSLPLFCPCVCSTFVLSTGVPRVRGGLCLWVCSGRSVQQGSVQQGVHVSCLVVVSVADLTLQQQDVHGLMPVWG